MSDARTISIKSGLQQDVRLVHCNCQAAYLGDTLSQQIATIFLPGGELQGANTPIHYHCLGDASIYEVELRSLDGLTTHAARTLANVPNAEWYVTLDTDFTVPPGGDWYTVYVTAPSAGDPVYIRGILFVIGGAFPPAPVNTLAPVASGTVEIGQVLSSTSGTWTSEAPYILGYQWRRDGIAIPGATASTHTVVFEDIGPVIDCLVSATSAGGTTSVDSNDLIFDDAAYLPETAILVSTQSVGNSGGFTDSWDASLGGLSWSTTGVTTGRPIYDAAGGPDGRPLITSDGVDDNLVGNVTKGSNWTTLEMGGVFEALAPTAVIGVALFIGNNTFIRKQNAVANIEGVWRNSAAAGTIPTSAQHHWSTDFDGTTLAVRLAGSIQSTIVPTTLTELTDPRTVNIFSNAGVNALQLASLAWYVGARLTDDQRLHLRALLTYHTGVAC